MKRLMAILLTGCLILQPVTGAGAAVWGADFSSGVEDSFIVPEDSGNTDAQTGPDTGTAEGYTPDAGEGEEVVIPQDPPAEVLPEQNPSETVPPVEEVSGEEAQPGETPAPEVPDDSVQVVPEEPGEEIPSADEELFGEEENVEVFGDGEELLAAGGTGRLQVKVVSALPFRFLDERMPIKVSVTNGTGFSLDQTLYFSGEKSYSSEADFSGLEAGNYKVTVSVERFATYTQTVPVTDNTISKIEVHSARTMTGNDKSAGWVKYGDVDHNGEIGTGDIDKIVDAIYYNPTNMDANLTMNIDDSEEVDISDLQLAVQSYNYGDVSSVIESLSIPQEIKAAEGTAVIGGSLESVVNGTGSVQLAPASGEISVEHPVEMEFTLASGEASKEINGITISAPVEIGADSKDDGSVVASGISTGEVEVETADGSKITIPITDASVPEGAALLTAAAFTDLMTAGTGEARRESDGSIVVDFGGKVAVKKVTIKITGTTRKEDQLVNISKVEFVNDMAQRIPAPQLAIPALNEPVIANEEFTVSWTPQQNVTAYDLYVKGPVKKVSGDQVQIIRVAGTKHVVTSINDNPVMNFEKYTIKVRSVNGDWTSQWSEEKIVTPEPQAVPDKPDNLTLKEGYLSLMASWKDMDDSSAYMLYYKKTSQPDAPYVPVMEGFEEGTMDQTKMISTNSWTITGLEDGEEYSVYVRGWNSKGWGPASDVSVMRTKSGDLPRLPEYRMINTPGKEGELTAHIVRAIHGDHNGAKMVESPLDQNQATARPSESWTYWAYGVVDNNYASYWTKNDWDDGVSYVVNNFSKGITVTLDNDYEMSYLTFTAADLVGKPTEARIFYWTGTDQTRKEVGTTVLQRTDDNNHPFFIVRFHHEITANRILLCLGGGGTNQKKVAEIRFHSYDPLEGEIYGLYADDTHNTLAEGVTEAKIQELEARLKVPDEVSGELHPLADYLELELKNARDLLNDQLGDPVQVDNRITARKDGHLGFGGLNSWQPLGRVVYAGEVLNVQVGHNFKKVGENSDLTLVFTQYHPESNSLSKGNVTLKVGKNEITVPQIIDKDYEKGGQIYVAYNGNNSLDQYSVRIQGGSKIPVLNIYKKEGDAKKQAISAYIKELEEYVAKIPQLHQEIHTAKTSVNYTYDPKLCVLNSTDIMMEYMMYSVPATQVWDALNEHVKTVNVDKETALENSLDAMEKTMLLFYQHKGLSNDSGGVNGNNNLPSQHLNIRYMRMFSGAFMYASGNHIGVEWNETKFASGAASWDSFGWGVAHEIGHDINQGSYAIAEITNNYFAQLLTIGNGTRFKYEDPEGGDDVYKKVTSGAIGRSPNGAVQLALYWQLHLAYDNYPDRTIFTDYNQMFNNLFFARVDTYARNPGRAPTGLVNAEGNKYFPLESGSSDQNLMRLSCAAANANILPFFERWGMVPDATTVEYATKTFGPATDKALYYVNDSARDYRAANPNGAGIAGQDVVSASVSAQGGYATLTINTTSDPNLILGYEIIRGTYSNGKLSDEVVGFKKCDGTATVYTDKISTMNNRVMYYTVKAVDKYLNYANPESAGSVKIETGGALNKENWTVATIGMTSADDNNPITPDMNDPDSGYNASNPASTGEKYPHTIDRVIDGNVNTVYNGSAGSGAEIMIDMMEKKEVTSLKYKGEGSALSSLTVAVSENAADWTVVKEPGYPVTVGADGFVTVWFNSTSEADRDKWIGTYEARFVKISVPAGGVSIAEIEVCGPSGDNLEFWSVDNQSGIKAIGKLDGDFVYGKEEKDKIPTGSLVFIGEYKGNPAYNVVILYDAKGNVIGAKDGNVESHQIIMAPDPGNGNLGETSEGTWIYYVEPGNWDEATVSAVQQTGGVRGELYRVDDALSNAGERVVSDTKIISMPGYADLPNVKLTGVTIPGATS